MRGRSVRKIIWVCISIALLCALGLIVLLATAAVEKGVGFWGGVALGVVGVLAVAGAIVPLVLPEGKRLPRRVRLPAQILVGVILVTFAALGALSDTLGLLEPRAAVESSPGAMEGQLKAISAAVVHPQPSSRTRLQLKQRIAGRWGESDCGVVYAFEVEGDHVVVDAVRRPPSAPPYRLTATIVGWRDNALEVRGESPAEARGKSATFRFWTNGVDRRLTWDDPAGRGSLELIPCS